MKPITKKDIIQSAIFLAVLSLSIFFLAKYLGDSRAHEFKENGVLASATVTKKYTQFSRTGNTSNKEYFVDIIFYINDSVNGKHIRTSTLKLYFENYQKVNYNSELSILYLISNPNEIELESVINK